jgi:hypothetical protein
MDNLSCGNLRPPLSSGNRTYRWSVQRTSLRRIYNPIPGMAITIPGRLFCDRHQPGTLIALIPEC